MKIGLVSTSMDFLSTDTSFFAKKAESYNIKVYKKYTKSV